LPSVKYPYSQHEAENQAEEDRCIKAAQDIIAQRRAAGTDVGAIIIEPITVLGNYSAAPTFYKRLR
jgi:4-aminobutyrate aminotransferase/(S)-3-amino-2-methylpropionate transaminase